MHGTINLQFVPKRDDSVLHVYLVPDGQADWPHAKLLHRIGMRFWQYGPEVTGKSVDFRFSEVTPGKYSVKIVFDVAEPHAGEDAVTEGSKGDYAGAAPEPSVVWAGKVSEAGVVTIAKIEK